MNHPGRRKVIGIDSSLSVCSMMVCCVRRFALLACAPIVDRYTTRPGRAISSADFNVAAISCGIYNGTPVLDLDYAEDSEADTDANFVMTGDGRIIEVQGTAEKTPFSQEEFLSLMALARKGVARLVDLQKMAVA